MLLPQRKKQQAQHLRKINKHQNMLKHNPHPVLFPIIFLAHFALVIIFQGCSQEDAKPNSSKAAVEKHSSKTKTEERNFRRDEQELSEVASSIFFLF
tara:strand:- start:852 stop:1142 length:291 start_codon:yes stop_codon:yes gene_type:complete